MELTSREAALEHLAGCGSDHSTKSTREMCGISEPGGVCGIGDGPAPCKLAGAALEPQPQHVRPERNADRCGEKVHESRRREPHARGDSIKGHRIGVAQPRR